MSLIVSEIETDRSDFGYCLAVANCRLQSPLHQILQDPEFVLSEGIDDPSLVCRDRHGATWSVDDAATSIRGVLNGIGIENSVIDPAGFIYPYGE